MQYKTLTLSPNLFKMTKVAIMCVVGIKFSFKDGFADYCSPEKPE